MAKELSIIIVSWNCKSYVLRCLQSVYENSVGIDFEIILIDNCSRDRTTEEVSRNFPEVVVVSNDSNIGFPAANNLGFSLASGEYILVLNPDTEVHDGTLIASLNSLKKNPQYGCVGVKTRKPSGRIQFSCARQFPTLAGILSLILFLDKIFPKCKAFSSQDMAFWDHENSKDVDMVAGSYMMMPKRVIERIGGFDERLPMFLEDCEYCVRLSKHGYKIRYLADVEITHYAGKSTEKAVPAWISMLRFEAFHILLCDLYGPEKAKHLASILLVVLPFRILYLPLVSIYQSILRGQDAMFRPYLLESVAGIKWAIGKIRC